MSTASRGELLWDSFWQGIHEEHLAMQARRATRMAAEQDRAASETPIEAPAPTSRTQPVSKRKPKRKVPA